MIDMFRATVFGLAVLLALPTTVFASEMDDKLRDAAWKGDIHEVKLAIDKGARINSSTVVKKDTPLTVASERGRVKVVEFFLGNGAEHSAENDRALAMAAQNGHTEIVNMLIDWGIDVNSKFAGGQTPLMYAAQSGRTDIVNLLLSKDADPFIKATEGENKTALDMARAYGHADVVHILGSIPPRKTAAKAPAKKKVTSPKKTMNATASSDTPVEEMEQANEIGGAVEPQRETVAVAAEEPVARPAPKEEVYKTITYAEVKKNHDELVSRHNIQSWPAANELMANPYNYEGKVVAIPATFLQMISRSDGLFRLSQRGSDNMAKVSDIPNGTFKTSGRVLIIGKVTGNTKLDSVKTGMLSPHMKFVGVHFCETMSCADILPREVR